MGEQRFSLTALIREEDGLFSSLCVELDVASCGNTEHEALENLQDAVEVYLETLRDEGLLDEALSRLGSAKEATFEVSV